MHTQIGRISVQNNLEQNTFNLNDGLNYCAGIDIYF